MSVGGVPTRSRRVAQAAHRGIRDQFARANKKDFEAYQSFAKKFPALIHTCGLAQAVSFAMAKGERGYLDDLASALRAGGHSGIDTCEALGERARTESMSGYLRLSRDAIEAASWLKRYVEARGEAG